MAGNLGNRYSGEEDRHQKTTNDHLLELLSTSWLLGASVKVSGDYALLVVRILDNLRRNHAVCNIFGLEIFFSHGKPLKGMEGGRFGR